MKKKTSWIIPGGFLFLSGALAGSKTESTAYNLSNSTLTPPPWLPNLLSRYLNDSIT